MTGIKELLSDVAAEAVPYDVADRALRTARRQRRIARGAPIAVAVLVAAGIAVALPLRHDASGTVDTASVGWLPDDLAPVGSPPTLPSGPVAPGVLAYVQNDGTTTLLTEGGRRYSLGTGVGGTVRGFSPDGRWVVFTKDEKLVARDLTGTANRDLGPAETAEIAAWSADGRWLAVRTGGRDPNGYETAVVDLDTGRRTTSVKAGRYGPGFVCGLRDNAELIVCVGDDKLPVFDLWVVDGTNGKELRHDTVDPSGFLTDSEREADWATMNGAGNGDGRLLPDGRTLVLRAADYLDGVSEPGDLLAYDLDRPDAAPRRYPLPEPVPGAEHRRADGTSNYDAGEFRDALAGVDGGLVLAHVVPSGKDGRVAALEFLDATTGDLTAVTTVSGDIQWVFTRGQARP